jgi:hypothetical protein
MNFTRIAFAALVPSRHTLPSEASRLPFCPLSGTSSSNTPLFTGRRRE